MFGYVWLYLFFEIKFKGLFKGGFMPDLLERNVLEAFIDGEIRKGTQDDAAPKDRANTNTLRNNKQRILSSLPSMNKLLQKLPGIEGVYNLSVDNLSLVGAGFDNVIIGFSLNGLNYCFKIGQEEEEIAKKSLQSEYECYLENGHEASRDVFLVKSGDDPLGFIKPVENVAILNLVKGETLDDFLASSTNADSEKLKYLASAIKQTSTGREDCRPQTLATKGHYDVKCANYMLVKEDDGSVKVVPFDPNPKNKESYERSGLWSIVQQYSQCLSDMGVDNGPLDDFWIAKNSLPSSVDQKDYFKIAQCVLADEEGLTDEASVVGYIEDKLTFFNQLNYHLSLIKEVNKKEIIDNASVLENFKDLKLELGGKIYVELYKGECEVEAEAEGCQGTGEASTVDKVKGKRIFSNAFDLLGTAVFEMDESAFGSVNEVINQWKGEHPVSFNKFRVLCLGLNPSERLEFMQACMEYSDDKENILSGFWRDDYNYNNRDSRVNVNKKLNEFRHEFRRDGFRSVRNFISVIVAQLVIFGLLRLGFRAVKDCGKQKTTHVKSLLGNQAVMGLIAKRRNNSGGSDLVNN